MVKVINPLFSNAAAGKCGGLIYQSGKNGPYVKGHVPQNKRPSTAQIQQNYFFGVTADAWRVLSTEQKAEYNTRAIPLQISGYNLYIKENIQHP